MGKARADPFAGHQIPPDSAAGSRSMFGSSRGGVRGGQDQFSWEDVKTDKQRENYLGKGLILLKPSVPASLSPLARFWGAMMLTGGHSLQGTL